MAREEQEGGSEKEASLAFRVCDKLRRPLSKLMGLTAFCALLSRALALGKAEASCLGAIQVAADGSLTGLAEMEAECPEEAAEGEVTLVAHLLGLLVSFIGKGLTVSLVREIWPDVSFNDQNPRKEHKQ